MLVHDMTAAGPIPTAYDPDGVYPYPSFVETAARPRLQRLHFITLENDCLAAEVCISLGGKVTALSVKRADGSRVNVLATPEVVRPVRILPRNAFVGGGIEVSFPISHTPSLLEVVCVDAALEGGRAYVTCGETELRFGMQWSVEYSLAPGEDFLTQRAVFANPTPRAHPWMSWSNAGVPAAPDTQLHFPAGCVLQHGATICDIDWELNGPRTQGDIHTMTGFFWRDPPAHGAFGVWTPSLGVGLYHAADPAAVPGCKLWSDGVGAHEPWVSQYMANAASQLLEIQAGPLADQSVKAVLAPGATATHTEFWFPVLAPRELALLRAPAPMLRPAPPRFGWARPTELRTWDALAAAHVARAPGALPAAPDATTLDWPPSGNDSLGDALEWAAVAAPDAQQRSAWELHLGSWLAGRGEPDAALAVLERSSDDRAHALAGRLLRRVRHDAPAAAAAFRRIRDPAFARHPQVVVERDLALAAAGGAGALVERGAWLDALSALKDEAIVERRAALLAARGEWAPARALLEGMRWQLVHQRYARTRLWRRIVAAMGEGGGSTTLPHNFLGEDALAEFGAYREFGEDVEPTEIE